MRLSGLALLLTTVAGCSQPGPPKRTEHPLLDRVVPNAFGAVTAAHARARPAARRPQPPRSVQISAITLEAPIDPLRGRTDKELRALYTTHDNSLGSISVGRPNRGGLRNAAQLPERPFWTIINPKRSWATAETIASLEAAVGQVDASVPNTPPLFIGDLSREQGGWIRPHRSHQSGRDVDLGYYYLGAQKWYTKANATNLDRGRIWQLLKALMAETDVEFVFMDRSIQTLLREHALAAGEDAVFLESVFQRSSQDETLVRHTYGHLTHFHVRFHNSLATAAFEGLRKRFGPRFRP